MAQHGRSRWYAIATMAVFIVCLALVVGFILAAVLLPIVGMEISAAGL